LVVVVVLLLLLLLQGPAVATTDMTHAADECKWQSRTCWTAPVLFCQQLLVVNELVRVSLIVG
jgi:hypothetical protein